MALSKRGKPYKPELTVRSREIVGLTPDLVGLFKSRVSTAPDAKGCLLWLGALYGGKKYGHFHIHGHQTHRAHRVAFYIRHGYCDPKLLVRHTCGNATCVNPDHLEQGTNADNSADAIRHGTQPRGDEHWAKKKPECLARGESHYSRTRPEALARGLRNGAYTKPECRVRCDRHGSRLHPERRPKGEKHANAKLTTSEVLEIRAHYASGLPQKAISIAFGVSKSLISQICLRQAWAHLS